MDERESFHVTQEDFAHFSDLEWTSVGRRSSAVGNIGVTAMLESLDIDKKHASVARFIHYELATEREKVALLHQQVSQQFEQLRELGDQQTYLFKHHHSNDAVGGTTHARHPEVMKVDISKYREVEEESLL